MSAAVVHCSGVQNWIGGTDVGAVGRGGVGLWDQFLRTALHTII